MENNDNFQTNGLNIQKSNRAFVEKKIADAIRLTIDSLHPELMDCLIDYTEPEIKIWDSESETYTSEISITFNRHGQFYDMFEFFIFRKGKQEVDESDVKKWMLDNLKELVKNTKLAE